MKKLSITFMLIVVGTLLSNILGFVRELLLAYKYGTSEVVDIYVISTTLPITVFALFLTAMTTTYIPTVSKLDKKRLSSDDVNYFTSNLINFVLCITVLIFVICICFTEQILTLFAIGFSENSMEIAVNLTRKMFLGIFPIAVYMILQNYLNFKNKFTAVAFIGAILNVAWIIGILFSTQENLVPIAIGNIIGYLIVAVFITILAIKRDFKYYPYLNLKNEDLKKIISLAFPVFLGLSVTQLNVIVDRSIATTIGTGIVSILNYSSRLLFFVYGITVIPFITIAYPRLSNIFVENKAQFKDEVIKGVLINIFMLLPLTIFIFIYSTEIVKVIFARGAFNENDIVMTSFSLRFYILSLIGLGIREWFSKVFYIMEDARTPLKNGALLVLMNISITLLGVIVFDMGYKILSISTSAATLIALITYFFQLNKKLQLNILKNNIYIKDTIKLMIANIISLIILLVFRAIVNDEHYMMNLIIGFLIYMCCYVVTIWSLKFSIIKAYFTKMHTG